MLAVYTSLPIVRFQLPFSVITVSFKVFPMIKPNERVPFSVTSVHIKGQGVLYW